MGNIFTKLKDVIFWFFGGIIAALLFFSFGNKTPNSTIETKAEKAKLKKESEIEKTDASSLLANSSNAAAHISATERIKNKLRASGRKQE